MKMLLKFLIYSLRTIDGYKNSANKLLQAMNKSVMDQYSKDNNNLQPPEYKRLEII